MALPSQTLLLFLSLLSLSTSLSLSLSLSSFSPIDNYLLDCGSSSASTLRDGRRFLPDHHSSPFLLSPNPNLYNSARIFRRPAKYSFPIRDPGTHIIRLHFHAFNSSSSDWSHSQFHVIVNAFVALKVNASSLTTPLIKEYLIPTSGDSLVIRFVPFGKCSFAFVNAIEVVSAPKDLVADEAMYVGNGTVLGIHGAMEVVHRVNVGGSLVTPFNDTLWRTWITDEEFFEEFKGSERVYFGGRVKYREGGASREVGPDNVYNTARLIRSRNGSVASGNMTWSFPVVGGFKYLVRLHFCDVASVSIGLLYFNVYVNGKVAYEDLDLSKAADYMLASPFYADFVVNGGDLGVLSVSVGPSKSSVSFAVDGILNGVEIMKMNNSVGSLDGEHCAEWVLRSWPRGGVNVLVPIVAAACVLLSLSMVTRRRIMKRKESVAWTKLPVDVSEATAKL